MSDIFGNLNNFLDNFDEDDIASTSVLNDTENSITNNSLDSSRNNRNSKSTGVTKNKSTRSKSITNSSTTRTNATKKNTRTTRSSDVGTTIDTLASTPHLLSPPVVDSTQILAGVAEEIRQLSRTFDSIYCSQNPIVKEYLKNRSAALVKRNYSTLCNSYHRSPPVTANDVKKLMKKIDTLKTNLKQQEQIIAAIVAPASTNPFPPQSRPRQPRRQAAAANHGPVLAVISLDCDDEPTSSQPIFQSRRVTRSSGAIEAGPQSNVISLDSDDEPEAVVRQSSGANASFEAENYEMRIKVKWGLGVETFIHRRYQKFADIIDQLAAKASADSECIFLNLKDRIVYPCDTPDSIDYESHQFISGRVLRNKAPTLPATHGPSSAGNSNMITLKVQLEKRKQPLRLQIDKNQTMSVLVIKCAEELKCEPKAIRLYFDGDMVDNTSKPADLELEGDEMLDCRFVK